MLAHRLRDTLRLRRDHAVEGPPDVGKVERDRRRWLALELREAGDRRAQVALAGVRRGRRPGKPIEHGLQGHWGGGSGEGDWASWRAPGGPLRSGADPGGHGVTFGNSLIAQMGFLLHRSIPDNSKNTLHYHDL